MTTPTQGEHAQTEAPADIENLRKALQFYADGHHFVMHDETAWDTVSGEPVNFYEDEAGTATVEDGSIAKLALAGHPIKFEDEDATAQPAAPQGGAYADAHGAIMGAAYDFRDAHISGSPNQKRSAHAALESAVTHALRASNGQSPATRITVEQVEDAIGLQSTAWDTIGAEKIVEAVLRLANGQAPAGATNTKTHALLSTMIGLFLRAKEKIGYQPGSAIDKTVAEAVEHLKDWPYPETPTAQAAPATQQAGEVRTCKQDLQVAVWVMPDGKGGGQFSWEAQDERFWVRLSAPQPSPTAQAAPAAKAEVRRSDLVPGVMHCAKCKFQLNRVTLCVSDGNAYAGDNKTEPCPNGCGPLWPVTWEQEARNCWKTLEEMHERLQAAPATTDFTTLDAAMRAIQQAIGLIGEPADERMQTIKRVLRGAVIVAEDSGEMAAPAAGAVAGPDDDIDAVALARYKVVPSHDSMFHRFAVVAGDGKQQLYLGRETECQNMARKFAGAFLDGAFHQSQIAAAPTTAAQADSQPAPVAAFEVADAMADSQYLAGVSAGWNAANADDPNAALQKLHESRAGYLKPLSASRAPADSVLEDAARWFSERDNVLHSFWVLLGEAETQADNDNNPLLKHQVEGFYRQWNALNGSALEPRWVTRAARKQGGV